MKPFRVTICMSSFAWLLTACSGADTRPEEPTLVLPASVLSGEPFTLGVEGLEAGQVIDLSLSRISSRNDTIRLFQSEVSLTADKMGHAKTSPDPKGSLEIQTGTLFNAMEEVDDKPENVRPWKTIEVSADLDRDGTADLIGQFDLRPYDENLIETPLGEDFPGAFIIRAEGDEKLPVIVALGGSEGNDWGARTSGRRFASRGYAALGLPYYSPAWGSPQKIPGLPKGFANIDVDYLRRAVDEAAKRDDLDTSKLGFYGVSKGAEYVLLAGTQMAEVDAIAAIVPTDVVWEGWGAGETVSSFSFKGEPYPFVPYKGMNEERAKPKPEIRKAHDAGRAAFPDRVLPARIEVESIKAPVFLVGGDKDIVWDSGGMARKIERTREQVGLETRLFVSATAGHGLSGDGYGYGTDPANAILQREAYPALIEFFDEALK